MRSIFALSALVSLTALLPAQKGASDEGKAIREFKKEFRSTKKRPRTLQERLAALQKLRGFDSYRTARALAEAFQIVEDEVAAEDARRLEINEEIRRIIKGQEYEQERTIPRPQYQRWQELQKLFQLQRAKLDNLRQLQGTIGELIRDLKKYESLSWLVRNVLTNKNNSLLLKITVCSSAGGMSDKLLDDMKKAFKKAKKSLDLAALLEGIGHLGKDARSLGPDLMKLLAHKDPLIGERAALALARVQYAQAVEPLIDLLEKTKGQMQKRIGFALEDLTGQRHGTSVSSWRGWYEKEGKELVATGKLVPQGGGSRMFHSRQGVQQGRYYMGIPLDGEAIVYVIDSSGSMKKPVKWGKPGHRRGGITVARSRDEKEPGKWATSRLEACKKELIEALEKLTRQKTFNIIWYSDLPHKWKESMQKALPMNIKDAQDWVRKLQPNSMTNIHDALQTAFEFAKGRGIKDKAYAYGKDGFVVDTIFLLTDGSPTKPDGTIDDHEKILVAVRDWNPLKRVVIHTIGIGEDLNYDFMERLAAENGGEFKHFTDAGERKR